MNKTEFELDIEGLRELMKSNEMQEILDEIGSNVANKASMLSGGEAFGYSHHIANYVAISTIYPESKAAARASYQDNVLEKSLSGLPRTK